jgi:hypothetical protein
MLPLKFFSQDTKSSRKYLFMYPELIEGYETPRRVWKPFRVPVGDWPLAICDATSVDQADLVAADIIYPNYHAENRMVHFNENQKWYWLPDQAANEVLTFKAIDSDNPSSSPCPHGAFPLPGQDKNSSSRESIDVRLLVMYADMIYPDSKPWSSAY